MVQILLSAEAEDGDDQAEAETYQDHCEHECPGRVLVVRGQSEFRRDGHRDLLFHWRAQAVDEGCTFRVRQRLRPLCVVDDKEKLVRLFIRINPVDIPELFSAGDADLMRIS